MNNFSATHKSEGISVVLCGQAGQGIQTVEFLLTRLLKLSGFNIFATKEYMSRIRGGSNSTEIRISSTSVRAPADRIDILIALNKGAVQHLGKRITPQTIILADREMLNGDFDISLYKFIDMPFNKLAAEIGGKIYSNIIAVGALASLFRIDLSQVTACVSQYFAKKQSEMVGKNINAAKAGHEYAARLVDSGEIKFDVNRADYVKDHILLSGGDAVALGAIAGGCNFVAGYPMTPSTSVLVFLAKYAEEFELIVEQAEDEIAAINMALGAWFAGARAMVSTSGGGFVLMTEGLSLAGMLEMPIVIHLGQRPGPATGLPTRTEQADLELALYAGHGEFPRVILTPGGIEDAFYLTAMAFNIADKYQVPVFVLTDQHLVDSYYNLQAFDLSQLKIEKHFVETAADYKRYRLTDSGISPRGIPGWGQGMICVDSDEHDQQGHITEDLDLRTKMVNKRLKKLDLLKAETITPELTGPAEYKHLIICWGSTHNVVAEAVRHTGRDDVAFLHFSQVYPLHETAADYLKKAQNIIIVENNATSQFGKLIKLYTGIDIAKKILKYNGLPFSVEELAENLDGLLK